MENEFKKKKSKGNNNSKNKPNKNGEENFRNGILKIISNTYAEFKIS